MTHKPLLLLLLLSFLYLQPALAQHRTSIQTVNPSLRSTLHPNLLPKPSDERCGFDRNRLFPTPEKKEWLRKWEQAIQKRMKERKGERTENTTYTIPIIVHVVHNGEPIGEGANISAEQVYSQIEVLNEDFNATNADLADTRPEFIDMAGIMNIKFAAALFDPEGNPLEEPGIQRYNSGRSSWSSTDFDENVKPATQFDPFRYANFWTASLSGSLLGYAQFPLNPVVPGLPQGDPDTQVFDGVVMGYQYFGSIDKVNTPQLQQGAPYNLGRTATHEVGHWLGLFHIWGDGGCDVDDEVADTPDQSGSSAGCPSDDKSTCGQLDMWENFMDYTDDGCMSLFSQGQADRMLTVLELDEMRQTLANSDVPVQGGNTFQSSNTLSCIGGSIDFQAVFSSDLEVDRWEFEGGQPSTSTETNPTVTYNDEGSFDVVLILKGVDKDTSVRIEETDLITIINPSNSQSPNISEGFEAGIPGSWQNLQGNWQIATVGNSSSQSLLIDHFNNTYTQDQELRLPTLDVQNDMEGLSISFDLAYASNNEAREVLEIGYYEPCTGEYTRLFRESGEDLFTAEPTTELFIPNNGNDWQRITLNVQDISTIDFIQPTIISRGNQGNRIYIDNINVNAVSGAAPSFEIEGGNIVCPGAAVNFINTSVFFGNNVATAWEWSFEEGLPLTSTQESPQGIVFPNPGFFDITLTAFIGTEEYSITFPDAIEVLDLNQQATQIEEGFEDDFSALDNPLWQVNEAWLPIEGIGAYGDSRNSLAIDNFNNDYTGEDILITLPNVSLQANENAYLRFDVAYQGYDDGIGGTFDNLEVLYTTDCGDNYTKLAFLDGKSLSTAGVGQSPFVPAASQWKEIYLPLYEINNDNSISSLQFSIRIYGNFGNVMWLDNIKVESFPSAPPIARFYTNNYPQPEDMGDVFAGEEVQFTDESELNPQFWTWSFEGATPAVSNERNPVVSYERPGTYNVSLTVSNAYGTGTLTKSTYIVVKSPSDAEPLTIVHTEGNEIIDASDGYGYVAGHNSFGDEAVAEYFENPNPYVLLSKVELGFLEILRNSNGNGESSIRMNVWEEGSDGTPGTLLGSADIPVQQAMDDAESGNLTTVNLDDPIRISSGFFIGIELPYNGIEVNPGEYNGDLFSLRTDEVANNSAWTKFGSSGDWFPFNSTDNWGAEVSRALWIFPTLSTDVVTGIDGTALSQSIMAFPNPTQGLITIDAGDLRLQAYEVIDLVGKTVSSGVFEYGNRSIELGSLPNGMYFLKLYSDRGTALKKVLLKR